MSIIKIPELRRRFGQQIDRALPATKRTIGRARVAAGERLILKESQEAQPRTYDIFLSHSYADYEEIFYVKRLLEQHGHSVYVDWIEDRQLSREHVDVATAAVLRQRVRSCKALIVAKSTNAETSRWIPWELGYADGLGKRVATLPYWGDDDVGAYAGVEYLDLYPYVSEEKDTSGRLRLWSRRDTRTWVTFSGWLTGKEPASHAPSKRSTR